MPCKRFVPRFGVAALMFAAAPASAQSPATQPVLLGEFGLPASAGRPPPQRSDDGTLFYVVQSQGPAWTLSIGREAIPGEFPSVVRLHLWYWNAAKNAYDSPATCSGSIILEDIIVTAAHCLVTETNAKADWVDVYYGDVKVNGPNSGLGQRLDAPKAVMIPKTFNPKDLRVDDIAVMRLPNAISESDTLGATALATPAIRQAADKIYFLAGWGGTKKVNVGGAPHTVLPDNLLYNTVALRTPLSDQPLLRADRMEKGQVIGACGGDSGGPLAFSKKAGDLADTYLLGVVSHSTNPDLALPRNVDTFCLHPDTGTQFTSVIAYRNFIIDALKQLGADASKLKFYPPH